MRGLRQRPLLLVVISAIVAITSCSSEVGGAAEVCEPDLLSSSGDVQAASDDIEAWALFFATYQGLTSGEPVFVPEGEEIKIVWRATGEGDVTFQAIGPDGSSIAPIWGPEGHAGSSWDDHPGDEWGTGWVFPEAGCWSIELRREDGSAAYLDVDIRA